MTTTQTPAAEDFFTGLPSEIQTVLIQAAVRVSRTNSNFDADIVRSDVGTVYELLDTLGASKPLRLLTGRDLNEGVCTLTDPRARALVAGDDEAAATASSQVRDLVSATVSQLRSQRKAERRAKPDPAVRERKRERDRITQVSEARDRHRQRAETLQEEVQALRARVSQLEEEQEETSRLLGATRQQVTTLRTHFTDPRALALALLDEIDATLNAPDHPAAQTASPLAPYAHLGLPVAPVALADTLQRSRGGSHASSTAQDIDGDDPGGEDGGTHRGARKFLTHFRELLHCLAAPNTPASRTEAGADRGLRVDVLGGGAEIGGSSVLLTAADTRILVDCGVRPRGGTAEDMRPPGYDRALAGRIDAVVITHAHNDHAGWVPALLAERPDVPVYATSATADLLATMWFDSAKVLARNGVTAYNDSDVRRALDAIRETNFRHPVRCGDLNFELFPAGHIVGAAGVIVIAGDQRVVVSGDVSAAGQETVGGFSASAAAQGADLLLLETTYAGDIRHQEPRAKVVRDFFATVDRVVERDGVVLVPAFALGRAQEVALLCARHAPGVPVLIDGLARAVTEVYERHPGPDGQVRAIFSSQVRRVPPGGTAEAARTFRGGVVITTSGMLNQGPAVTWARRVLPDVNSALMVVGYQDEESPGAKLLRLADRGGGQFMLPSQREAEPETVTVHADVARYQLGAHANAEELAGIVQRLQPRQLMPVHGERGSQAQFAARMRQRAQILVEPGTWAR